MRHTYSQLLQKSKDFAIDDGSTSSNNISSTSSFLATQINDTISYLFERIRNYKTQPLPKTMSTVADQIYYHYPPNLINIESVTMAIGDVDYPLRPVNSQHKWDQLQQIDITSSDIPQYYFPRQSDFGIWPTPSGVFTVTLVANYFPKRLSVADYTAGTVATTQNDATVTGTSTTFTSAMVGRWFVEANSSGIPVGRWYRITSFTSTTSIELESVFEEASLSGSNYIIAESPEIPEELHEYIPYRAAATYHATMRKDPQQAQALMNFFYTGDYNNPRRGNGITGGVLGIINRYKNTGRSNSQLNRLHKGTYSHWRDEAWATTLTGA